MPFYVKRADQLMEAIDPQRLVERMPEQAAAFDQMAEDKKYAEDSRTPTNWGPVMQGVGEYKRVARFPQAVWWALMKMHEDGLIPDPLKDDAFFYGLLFKHPNYQAYPMKRSA